MSDKPNEEGAEVPSVPLDFVENNTAFTIKLENARSGYELGDKLKINPSVTGDTLELLNSSLFMLNDVIEQFSTNRASRYMALAQRELESARHWIRDALDELKERNKIA